MKTVIIYKSKYGATKKYAEFLKEALDCDLLEIYRLKTMQLTGYDTIILGGGLYAGGISGLSFFTKNFDALANKNLIVFTVGLADPKNEANAKNIRSNFERTLGLEKSKKITLFHLHGGIDYARLNFLHRLMMKMMFNMLSKKKEAERNEEDRGFIEAYGKTVDFIDRITIKPIVDYVNKT